METVTGAAATPLRALKIAAFLAAALFVTSVFYAAARALQRMRRASPIINEIAEGGSPPPPQAMARSYLLGGIQQAIAQSRALRKPNVA
jgi:hypothetical protein